MLDVWQVRGLNKFGDGGIDDYPSAINHGRVVYWDHNVLAFQLKDLTLADTKLISVYREIDGNSGKFKMSDDTILSLPLGALAWLNDFPEATIDLPGNTKILFDDNDSIGGDDSFTFDKYTKKLKLSNLNSIVARDTTRHSVYNSLLQYVGLRNILLNTSNSKTLLSTDVFEDNIIAGHQAFSNVTNAKKNIILGYMAGYYSEGVQNSVYIGPYAGRLETENNKLYIGNSDYATITEFRENSLIYGDFDNKILTINDHLRVREEIQIGDYLGTSPQGGMLKSTDDGGGGIKIQYHNGTDWQDFASGLNYYLDGITKVIADVGTTSDDYKLTFSVNGTSDQTIQLGTNAFNSTPIRDADGVIGNLQLSDGAGDFISSILNYNSTTDRLFIGKILRLTPVTDITAYNLISQNEDIIAYNNHIYAKLNGTLTRLDNEPSSGESNEGENLGTSIDLYAGMSIDRDLTFYGLKSGTRITINAPNIDNDIIIDADYSVTASSPVAAGVELIKTIDNTDPNITDIILRRLVSGDASVTFDVSDTDVIDIRATGAGGGEANVGVTLGGGIPVYKDKTPATVNLNFRSIGGDSYIIPSIDIDDSILLELENTVVGLDAVGTSGVSIIESYEEVSIDDTNLIYNLRKLNGINDIQVELDEAEHINIGFDPLIPIQSISFTGVSWNPATRLLAYGATVNANIRDTESSDVPVELVGLVLGNLLTYDSGTNTINATVQGLSGGDPLVDIETENIVKDINGIVDQFASSRNVNYILNSGTEIVFDELGFLAFQDIYTDATSTEKGIVSIGSRLTITDGIVNVPIATTEILGIVKIGDNLSIDEEGILSATLGGSLDAVLFNEIQYYLHDEDAGNLDPELDEYAYEVRLSRRLQARSNIGAAYINGSRIENFKTSGLDVNINEEGTVIGTKIRDNYITSDWGTIEIKKEYSNLSLSEGGYNVTLDTRVGGLGYITFNLIDSSGSTITVAQLAPRFDTERGLVADWLVSGNFEFAYDF
ncbi:MAG: hypothetical protein WC346_03835 [Methanogenium sp.]|jgi:hypothetical protein